jgi:hypothetical protein
MGVRVLLSRLTRRVKLPPGGAWLLLSALLFLVGSAGFGIGGAHTMAQIGLVAALVAVAVLIAAAP